jgi:uncharacterized protein (DUF608 family)
MRKEQSNFTSNGDLARRDFLKYTAMGTLGLTFSRMGVMAGPFTREDFEHLVPADKKLSPDWVKSLFARGEPQIYRGRDLKKIGMPVGGICAGQLYLGGDGRLWHWDIFNDVIGTGADHYAHPMEPESPLEQGFAIEIVADQKTQTRKFQEGDWREIAFRGEYPIGRVEYADEAAPVKVAMEAFSPFIPLNVDDSSLPATVIHFDVQNVSGAEIEVRLSGWLQNAICLQHEGASGTRKNRVTAGKGSTLLVCSVDKSEAPKIARQDIVFEDWSKTTYDGWRVEGTAFGAGPIKKSDAPGYQGDLGGDTERVVNSHAAAPGSSVGERDAATGKLTSSPFRIDRNFIKFWIGGGRHDGKTCLNLLIDGKVVRSATGRDDNRMEIQVFETAEFQGRNGVIEIVDAESGPWGNIGVGKIIFTDRSDDATPLEQHPDYGTMTLALLGEPADEKIAPGASAKFTFVLAWHFPNLTLARLGKVGRHYATRFASAAPVAEYIADNYTRLEATTRLWRDTWYDSTLPYWFLDRTFLNTSILATSTSHRFADGRFYGWEGVGCCEGTCGHVYHYAHAMGRLFPELERITREKIDFGLAQQPDGSIHFRGEFNDIPAIDAQSGAILRALREHQMSADGAFLERIWPGVRRAAEWLIAKDANGDGLIESNQHNTLDTDWFGAVAWLSGLYLAALTAAAAMADERGDAEFAAKCRGIVEVGRKNLVGQLFDGEYFINKVDPRHLDAINSGTGCEIDQVFGQSWAFQVGLPRVLPESETRTALKSLWLYNFSPDVGPYRDLNKEGRWYAMAGEAGLLMCSFPRRDWDYARAKGKGPGWAAGYFNECMNGFEHQAAGHMIWEGMLLEGFAVERALHDRYHASRRNPWNEIECGDHYARSMASYGVYLAASGFEYHGPKGRIGFAPRLSPENFKCAFTSAEGWGSYTQKIEGGKLTAEIAVKYGALKVGEIALEGSKGSGARVTVGQREEPARLRREGGRAVAVLDNAAVVKAGEVLTVVIS